MRNANHRASRGRRAAAAAADAIADGGELQKMRLRDRQLSARLDRVQEWCAQPAWSRFLAAMRERAGPRAEKVRERLRRLSGVQRWRWRRGLRRYTGSKVRL